MRRAALGSARPAASAGAVAARPGRREDRGAMSRRKTERLLSLVVCLLSASRYLTAARSARPCRATRTPSRRSSGCSSATRTSCASWASRWRPAPTRPATTRSATGSRARPTSCPRSGSSPTRRPCSGWPPGSGAGPSWPARPQGALLKLRAAGIEAEDTTQPGIEPRLHTGEAAFGPLWEAVRDRRPVTFAYRGGGPQRGRSSASLEPWGVVNRNGRWYVAGLDTDRGEERVFRLSRVDGPVTFTGPRGAVAVPAGTDARAAVRAWDFGLARRSGPARCGSGPAPGTGCAATRPSRPARGPARLGHDPGALLRQRLVERAPGLVRRRRRRAGAR